MACQEYGAGIMVIKYKQIREVAVRSGLVSAVTLAVLLGTTALARADGEGCSPVTTASLSISGVEIVASKLQEAGNGLPRHCIMTGLANRRTGTDGKSYAIQFEL